MRKVYRQPKIISECAFESSALSCAKVEPGGAFHIGPGSTYLSGHATDTVTYSHTPGTGGNWLHINPGYESSSPALCSLALMTS